MLITVIEIFWLFGVLQNAENRAAFNEELIAIVGDSFRAQTIFITIPMTYMFAASMYGLFSFDALEIIALHWGHRTDPISLVYSFINMWRLVVPVVYNALQIIGVDDCSFFTVLGKLQEVPIVGSGLHHFVYPGCFCLMLILTATGAVKRINWCLSKKHTYVSSNETNTMNRINEGLYEVNKFKDSFFLGEQVQG